MYIPVLWYVNYDKQPHEVRIIIVTWPERKLKIRNLEWLGQDKSVSCKAVSGLSPPTHAFLKNTCYFFFFFSWTDSQDKIFGIWIKALAVHKKGHQIHASWLAVWCPWRQVQRSLCVTVVQYLPNKVEKWDSCPQRTYRPVEKQKCHQIQHGNCYRGHTIRAEVDYGKRNPYLEGGWWKITEDIIVTQDVGLRTNRNLSGGEDSLWKRGRLRRALEIPSSSALMAHEI